MGKSLNDNPFNSMGFNINGIGISQEAIEENKRALRQLEEVKEAHDEEELKANVSEFLKEDIKNNINVSSEEKDLIQDLIENAREELKAKSKDDKDLEALESELNSKKEEINKKVSSVMTLSDKKEKTTKKTYIIKDEYIEIIEGLALLKNAQIKDIVNEVIKRGLNSIEDKHNGIIDKAKKSYKNKDKGNNDLF